MLNARKEALANNTRVRMIAIRERELQLYAANCRQLGRKTALLAGFAYSGLYYRTKKRFGLGGHSMQSGSFSEGVYVCMLTITMGCSLQALLVAMCTAMLGPGLALRGPDGAMHLAVSGVRAFYSYALLLYIIAIQLMMLTVVAFVWGSTLPIGGQVVASIVGLGIAGTILKYVHVLLMRFRVDEKEAASGAFFVDGGGAGDVRAPGAGPANPPPPLDAGEHAGGVGTACAGAGGAGAGAAAGGAAAAELRSGAACGEPRAGFGAGGSVGPTVGSAGGPGTACGPAATYGVDGSGGAAGCQSLDGGGVLGAAGGGAFGAAQPSAGSALSCSGGMAGEMPPEEAALRRVARTASVAVGVLGHSVRHGRAAVRSGVEAGRRLSVAAAARAARGSADATRAAAEDDDQPLCGSWSPAAHAAASGAPGPSGGPTPGASDALPSWDSGAPAAQAAASAAAAVTTGAAGCGCGCGTAAHWTAGAQPEQSSRAQAAPVGAGGASRRPPPSCSEPASLRAEL